MYSATHRSPGPAVSRRTPANHSRCPARRSGLTAAAAVSKGLAKDRHLRRRARDSLTTFCAVRSARGAPLAAPRGLHPARVEERSPAPDAGDVRARRAAVAPLDAVSQDHLTEFNRTIAKWTRLSGS